MLGIPTLDAAEVRRLARETGFQSRTHRKIEPLTFASVLLEESVKGVCSYNDLAVRIDEQQGGLVSRQAVGKRMNESCVQFLQAILGRALQVRVTGNSRQADTAQRRYGRVLVQDSTVVRLPARLFEAFSGVSNAHSKVCNARIQVVYDLVAGAFVSFSVDPYSRNDQTAAPDLELQPGDLVLRDRGYLLCGELQRHADAGAHCIYRHKINTAYIDPGTGRKLDLAARLEREGSIDTDVWLNNDQRTPVRLVAVPVCEEVANMRRMKLRKETRGHAPSKSLLCLMSWSIFVTTIPREEASFEELLDIYGLRWRIETIFKAWKSNLNLARIHNVSENQLRILMAARMTVIVLCTHVIFHAARRRVREHYGSELSLLKTTAYLAADCERVLKVARALQTTTGRNRHLDPLARYCTYDRRKRENFNRKLERLLEGWYLS